MWKFSRCNASLISQYAGRSFQNVEAILLVYYLIHIHMHPRPVHHSYFPQSDPVDQAFRIWKSFRKPKRCGMIKLALRSCQSLSACMASGSKLTLNDFLQLRVLYRTERAQRVQTNDIDAIVLQRVKKTLGQDPGINFLRRFRPLPQDSNRARQNHHWIKPHDAYASTCFPLQECQANDLEKR